MKRILMVASVVFVLLLSSSSILIADVIPKNPQLTSATTSSITVKRGEVFTITVGVNAFDGYIFSAGGSFYSTNSSSKPNTSFECRGYMPTEGDGSKVLAVQNGSISLKCVVPRNSLEGKYRLYYFDLSSVGCKKTYVMEFSNPAGVSCPHSWTHYAYRSGAFDNLSDPYATENQTTSLNYPVDIFTSFPTITIAGILPLEIPQIDLVFAYPDRISAKYYFGSQWDRDMQGLCAVESNIGTLSTNWILTGASLPLNGAAQPQFNESVNINVQELKPKTTVDLKITCKASNGDFASKVFQFQTTLPEPPQTPTILVTSITDQSAVLKVLNFLPENVKYEYTANGVTEGFTGDSVQLTLLKQNSTNTLKVSATDSFGQKSTSTTSIFRTSRSVTEIICVKGKLTKKVTAVKPKCPAGYKVKK